MKKSPPKPAALDWASLDRAMRNLLSRYINNITPAKDLKELAVAAAIISDQVRKQDKDYL